MLHSASLNLPQTSLQDAAPSGAAFFPLLVRIGSALDVEDIDIFSSREHHTLRQKSTRTIYKEPLPQGAP